MPKRRTKKEKKALLARLVELKVRGGFDITIYMGEPLSTWDYDKIENVIKVAEKQGL